MEGSRLLDLFVRHLFKSRAITSLKFLFKKKYFPTCATCSELPSNIIIIPSNLKPFLSPLFSPFSHLFLFFIFFVLKNMGKKLQLYPCIDVRSKRVYLRVCISLRSKFIIYISLLSLRMYFYLCRIFSQIIKCKNYPLLIICFSLKNIDLNFTFYELNR